MSLFSGLYVGNTGLFSSQDAINTTAHNLSNLNTIGYTRQQVEIDDRSYSTLSINSRSVSNQQVGFGSYYSYTKQVRDVFLDATYRREVGRQEYYVVAQETMEEVEDLLGELQGEAFQQDLNNVWTAVQELAKDPSNSVYQTMLVQFSEAFLESSKTVYDGFSNYQKNLDANVINYVKDINSYGDRIAELNHLIRKIEVGGEEHANDYRDERNLLMDEMSKLIQFEYKEDLLGNVNIMIDGETFVHADTTYHMSTLKNPDTGFVTCYWPHAAISYDLPDGTTRLDISSAEVFDFKRTIAPEYNNDVGGLKSTLVARGEKKATYADLEKDYDNVKKSLLMNVQAEFDSLIHNVVTAINDVLMQGAGMQKGDLLGTGTEVKYFENDPSGYMRLENGQPIQMFTIREGESFRKETVGGKEYWIYNEEDLDSPHTQYSIENIEISSEILQKPTLMGFIKDDKNIDYDTAEKLKAIFTAEIYTLNPDVATRHTIMSHYNALVSQVANQAYEFNSMRESQESTLNSIGDAREEVLGVSSDDELTNLIKYQNAYNASSRYITTLNQMIEHLLNSLAG